MTTLHPYVRSIPSLTEPPKVRPRWGWGGCTSLSSTYKEKEISLAKDIVLCVNHHASSLTLFTHVSLQRPFALPAGDIATPVIPAVTPLHRLLHVRIISSAAAHQMAAVTAVRCLVALPG